MIKTFSPLHLVLAAAVSAGGIGAAQADRIKHPTAVFAGLDKITGRIITFDVAIDETVQFGTIQVTPRICYTRPPTEAPQTTSFVEVDEVPVGSEMKRIFSGWMFAASPGLHAIEHPVYDVWLTDCRGGKDIIVTPPETADLRDSAPPAERPPAQRQQPARQATPSAPAAATLPPLGNVIDVGAAPGLRGSFVPVSPPQNAPARPPVPAPAREAPPALPPANIPAGR